MKRINPVRQRLAALGMLGFAGLNFPLVGLSSGDWLGMPASYLYLFGGWGGLILLAAWLAERRGG
ncbi:hypothetical protein GBK02_08605 [Dechloromonas sp. TW-R-39-2]|uniref:hypothetical protein n=1 Tax=Dechloromonas sp. TW-R-39-2 TaxID=2654218 RepID=UPI00193CBE1E|nr:hypothetical protein [Dechloromonas sp. TW-R-39-2]QRM19456.1 hypothetical protein GBK02_08605 [Dechloromonas sp. TW-R-39-2]